MKKQFAILGILLFSFLSLNTWAQESAFKDIPFHARNSGSFDKGYRLLSGGLGLINYSVPKDFILLGPVYLQYEHAVSSSFGIAAHFAYAHNVINKPEHLFLDPIKRIRNTYSFGLMAYYHFNKFLPYKNLDLFGGIGLSALYGETKYPDRPDDFQLTEALTGILFPIRFGARWYMHPRFSICSEIGLDIFSAIRLGFSFKI